MPMISTGCEALDQVLHGLRDDDTVLWQLDNLDDYRPFVNSLVAAASRSRRRIVYFVFAEQQPLVDATPQVSVRSLDTGGGFTALVQQIRAGLKAESSGTICLFDCLSCIGHLYMTDLMTANLASIVCRDLQRANITYIPLLRDRHSHAVLGHMQEATSVALDVYRCNGDLFLHPVKVSGRYSPSMFMPHLIENGRLKPVSTQRPPSAPSAAQLPTNRILEQALRLSKESPGTKQYENRLEQLCRVALGNEERMLGLARATLKPEDFVHIGQRMVGDGAIGGRAAGLLLASRILSQEENLHDARYLERVASYYVGSDVFCTYLADNGLWDLYAEQMTDEGYVRAGAELREQLLKGRFSDVIRQQFGNILEQLGPVPIIVRSSSVMEDSFRGAFAGKYESIFLANQGNPAHRLDQFEAAVRRVYSSVMNEDALAYRRQKGFDRQQEQMALVVQQVSGTYRQRYFAPDVAGVATSRNIFAWAPHLDPQAGMLRLVIGLGTRAVDRTENDYPRIVALDDPSLKAHGDTDDLVRFSQHEIDLLNLDTNGLETLSVDEFVRQDLGRWLSFFAVREHQTEQTMRQLGLRDGQAWVVTLDRLLTGTRFVQTMQQILRSLEQRYEHPIDVEFTLNLAEEAEPKICLVQCRPMQTIGTGEPVEVPTNVQSKTILFRSTGHMMGGNISRSIDTVLLVRSSPYCRASLTRKCEIARLVGHINRTFAKGRMGTTMLMGPGRWGTTTPSLGVPVSFAEINNADVLVEVAYEGGNLMPELSFGTHFFHDLVENNIFYVALFPRRDGVILGEDLLLGMTNRLPETLPQYREYAECVGLYHVDDIGLHIVGNVVSQEVLCFAKGR